MLYPQRVDQFRSNVTAVRNRVVQLSQVEANNELELSSIGQNLDKLMLGFQEYCQMIEEDCRLISSKENVQLKTFKAINNTSIRLVPESILLYLSQIINFLCIKASIIQQQWANYLEKVIENSIKYQYCCSPNTIKNCMISFHNLIVKAQKKQDQQIKFHKIIVSMLKRLIKYYFQRKKHTTKMLFFDQFNLQKTQQLLLNQTQWFSYCFTKIFSSPINSSLIFEEMLSKSTIIAYYTLHMIGNFFQDMIDKRITTQLVSGFGCEIKDIRQMYSQNNKCLVQLRITQQNLAYVCRYFLKHLRIQIESTIRYINLSLQKNLNTEEIQLLLKQSRQQMDLILQIIHNLNCIVFIGGYNNKLQNFVTSIVLEESTVFLEFFQISYLLYRCIEASKMTAKVTLMVQIEKQSRQNLFRIAGVPQNTQTNSLELQKILFDGQLVGVLRLLTNLVHINHRSQLPFESNPKYLHMILSLTHDSVSQATMKEWAIMFIRNVSQWSAVLRDDDNYITQMADEEVLYGLGTHKELTKKMLGRPLAKSHDLSSEMLTQLSDAIINGIQAYATFPNMQELATKNIKETLDKKYGPAWHVVMGEGYAYDISVQSGAYLLMYYNGYLGCLVFKT